MGNHLETLIDKVVGCLDGSSARRLAEMSFPQDVQARVDELAAKAGAGKITEDESDEYDTIVRFTTLVDILRLKARGNATRSAAG